MLTRLVAGLSGASWLICSMAGNRWQTITAIKTNFWHPGFAHELIDPNGAKHSISSTEAEHKIRKAVDAKDMAQQANGHNGTTLTDWWGRLLSHELFSPDTEGAIKQTFSAITQLDPFKQKEVPLPIITAMGVNFPKYCLPNSTAIQYEITPYSFGSWDTGVAAFTPTQNLGTSMSKGKATQGCTTNYDNIGYILGTSSSLFNEICHEQDTTKNGFAKQVLDGWSWLKHGRIETRRYYATYPNPFYKMDQDSALVAGDEELTLADGGETNQNDPIWPLLHRDDVSFILVNDNSADTKVKL